MLTGYLASASLAVFISAKDLLSKSIATRLSGTLSTFASFVFALPYYALALPLLWLLGYEDFSIAAGFFYLILLRGLTDTGAEWLKMIAISRAEISLVAAFHSLSPAFLALLSPLLTGDPLSAQQVTGLLVIAGASALLANPFGRSRLDPQAFSAVLIASASAFCFALNHCIDRLAVKTGSATLSGAAMTLIAGLYVMPWALGRKPLNAAKELAQAWRPLTSRGAFEVLSMVSKLLALQYLPATTVIAISRLAVIFSVLGGVKLYGETISMRRLLLVIVMLFGTLLVLI